MPKSASASFFPPSSGRRDLGLRATRAQWLELRGTVSARPRDPSGLRGNPRVRAEGDWRVEFIRLFVRCFHCLWPIPGISWRDCKSLINYYYKQSGKNVRRREGLWRTCPSTRFHAVCFLRVNGQVSFFYGTVRQKQAQEKDSR